LSDERIILKMEYGSRAHGTNTVDSDSDFMGVFVEPKEYVTGILHMDTQERKSAVKGTRSTAVDHDTVLYPLRKWAALAAKGNPTVLTVLFGQEDKYEVLTASGLNLLMNKRMFLSKQVGERFLGYMISQRNALLGTRNKKTNRPELVHKHGYDTKFAYHMLRLGIQGIEVMNTQRISLPMIPQNVNELLQIRNGEIDKQEMLDWSYKLEKNLRADINLSTLPDEPDVTGINKMLHGIYETEWRMMDRG